MKPEDKGKINPDWRWTMLLYDLVNRSKRGSNIYHRVMSPIEVVEVVPAIALDTLASKLEAEKARSKKLVAALQEISRQLVNAFAGEMSPSARAAKVLAEYEASNE